MILTLVIAEESEQQFSRSLPLKHLINYFFFLIMHISLNQDIYKGDSTKTSIFLIKKML